VTVSIDGAASGTAKIDQQGAWSYAVPAALADGVHTFTLQAGGEGFLSTGSIAGPPLTIDTVAPSVTLAPPDFADYRPAQVQVPASDAHGLNPQVHIDVDLQHDGQFTQAGDQDYGTGFLMGDGTATVTLSKPLPKGEFALRARVFDFAGNEGDSAT